MINGIILMKKQGKCRLGFIIWEIKWCIMAQMEQCVMENRM